MAIRQIRQDEDPILRKEARKIEVFDDKLHQLLNDMADTMDHSDIGVGLAAPQVGVLKRVVVFDVGEGLVELINPEIIQADGTIIEVEGCLSVPDVYGEVERPQNTKIRYWDRNGKSHKLKAEDFLSVVVNHELDHLDGVLFTDKVIQYVDPKEYYQEKQEQEEK